jgi:PAS domain S-box-containing protein
MRDRPTKPATEQVYVEALRKATESYEELIDELSVLRLLNDSFRTDMDFGEVCKTLIEFTTGAANVENASVMVMDYEQEELRLLAAKSFSEDKLAVFENGRWSGKAFSLGEGIAGQVAKERKSILIYDTLLDQRFVKAEGQKVEVRSILSLPLIHGDWLHGVLNLSNSDPQAFDPMKEHVLNLIASAASVALSRAIIFEELKRSNHKLSTQNVDLAALVTFLGVSRDITGRKRAEEELSKSEEKYRQVVENASEIILVHQDGFVKYANPSTTRITGYSEDDLANTFFLDLIHPEDRELLVKHHLKRMQAEVIPYKYEFRFFNKAGDIRWMDVDAVVITWDEKPATLAFLTDITERRQAELALKESEAKYRTLFEESLDGVFISTPDGKFLDINPAGVELFGYSSKEELMKIDIASDLYMDPSQREKVKRILDTHGFVKDYELHYRKKDGKIITVVETVNAVRDDSGNVVAYRGLQRDVTEQRKLQHQLLQAQKMESVGTLAGGIAHDFNNLLAGILGYASFMKSKMKQDDPFFAYADTIEKSSMRAAELTSQLLAFARGGKYDNKPIILNKVVEETLTIVERTLDKSVEVEAKFDTQLPTVEADSGQLQQVLMNLCVNARDAMPGGGKMIIETGVGEISEAYAEIHIGAKAGKYVILSVSDTGSGMDEQTKKRMFEPFYTTKEEGKGTGLGLSMVYGVVKNHGGHIDVYSEPGQGSIFKIYLPISGKPVTEKLPETEAPRGGHETVLVVDDEESFRSFTKDILQSHGYRVLLAVDGEDGVDIYQARKGNIDLVILDMVMPKMGGHETFLKMREDNPDVKVLLSTGYSRDGKAQEIIDSGIREFIQKPYKAEKLLSKVRSLLDAKD